MNRLSVRARLTLWNVGIVALLLIALGIAVRTVVRTSLMAGIDRELIERGENVRKETARRIRYENGRFVFLGRRPRDGKGKPRTFPLTGSIKPDEFRDAAPQPPDNDVYVPRLLNAAGKPPLPFFRAPAWDTDGVAAAARSHTVVLKTVSAGTPREPYRVVSMAIAAKNGTVQAEPLFVQLAFRLTDIERGLSALDTALLTLLPLSLLVSGISGAWLTGRALSPVRDITEATDKIAATSLSGRLPVTGGDEFSELSRRFNEMLERLETAFDKERRFVADASHELRTPLAIVTAHTSLALDDETPLTPDGARRSLTAIHAAAERMGRITRDLLLLAQSEGGAATYPRDHKAVRATTVLQAAIESVETAHRERTGKRGATVTLAQMPAITFPDADESCLVRVFVNLLENALRHTPHTGQVTVSARFGSDGFAAVRVADTGSGIAPEHLPHLFDRFYRADAGRDRERGGTGLGLSIVQTLIHAHGGTVAVESAVGHGTVVLVRLPAQ